jgi:hypothetical protein
MTRVTNKNWVGHFVKPNQKYRNNFHFVGDLIRTRPGFFKIVGQKPFGRGELLWESAEFNGREFKHAATFDGTKMYTAK